MPYFDVSEENRLYVAVAEKEIRFKQQCEIIKNWQSLKLSPQNLFNLPENFSEKDLKKAKMKLFLHFHPDKNNDSDCATEAFKILTHAADFLGNKLDAHIPIKNNPFGSKKGTDSKANTSKTYTAPPPVSAEEKAYLEKLSELAKSVSITPKQEQFFRKALKAHPEYLRLTFNQQNLFHFVLDKGGSSAFFQWLICQQYAEEALSKSKGIYDVFSSAFSAYRKDCLQILLGIYGIEGFHASSIDYSLSSFVLLIDEDKKASEIFWFLMNELNYIPKNGHAAISVLDAALSDADLPTFNRIYAKFKHILLEPDQPYSHNALLCRALTFNYSPIKLKKMADAGLMQYVTDPLFQRASELNVFLSQKNFNDMIGVLQKEYHLMKNLENLSQKTLEELSIKSLIILLDTKMISVEQVLQSSWMTAIDRNVLLGEALLKRDRAVFHAWFKHVELTPEYIKSQMGQAHLHLMLQYGIVFTEQQLKTIQSTFDAYFTDLAEKRVHYTEREYRFLPMTTEAWLFPVIECIGRSTDRMAWLNKTYDHEVKLVIQGETHDLSGGYSYRTGNRDVMSYEYTETILSSFTPLQFFMVMHKMPLAVLLLAQGVDWKQNISAITQTGINNPAHFAYNPDKVIRDFGLRINHHKENRCVKIILSDPDAKAQKSVVDSKEIILIHKNNQIEIGFCNHDYQYEQRVVSGTPNVVEAVKRAKLQGKITDTADLDAIERYLPELGICLYSSKQTQSTVLDFLTSEIENKPSQDDAKVALKQIQLNEAESYLYKRTFDASYKTKLSFFGFFTIMNFGFSKQEKTTAARALIDFLKKEIPIPMAYKPALSQGELGKIAAFSTIVFAPDPPRLDFQQNP